MSTFSDTNAVVRKRHGPRCHRARVVGSAIDLDKRRMESDREKEVAQRVALLDSCLHPSNEAVEALEEPRA